MLPMSLIDWTYARIQIRSVPPPQHGTDNAAVNVEAFRSHELTRTGGRAPYFET